MCGVEKNGRSETRLRNGFGVVGGGKIFSVAVVPSASVDNILLELQNSSYPARPHSITASYSNLGAIQLKSMRMTTVDF